MVLLHVLERIDVAVVDINVGTSCKFKGNLFPGLPV